MQEYFPAPERRYPSPSAQRRSGEHWKARLGLAMVVVLTLCSAAIMFRIAGLGVGAAISPFRGPATGAAPRPTQGAAPTAPVGQQPAGQPTAANQPAGQPTAGGQPAATAPAAAQPTAAPAAAPTQPAAAPSPTIRPGQREHMVQSGDNLFNIAQRYDTTIDALVAANNLRDRNVILSIGQRIVIP